MGGSAAVLRATNSPRGGARGCGEVLGWSALVREELVEEALDLVSGLLPGALPRLGLAGSAACSLDDALGGGTRSRCGETVLKRAGCSRLGDRERSGGTDGDVGEPEGLIDGDLERVARRFVDLHRPPLDGRPAAAGAPAASLPARPHGSSHGAP